MNPVMFRKRRPRVVVITGGSAGVGRACARLFAHRGDHVAVLARGKDGLDATVEEIESMGVRGIGIEVDVADAAAVEAAAAKAEEALGRIDIWVNNAMVTVFSPIAALEPDEFRRVTEVTYLGNVHGTMAALRRMLPRNRGVIVQVSSALAYRSIPLQSAYCGAKHAIAGFTDSLRSELLHDGSRVRVTEVELPAMNTPQFGWARNRMPHCPQPVPPIYQPEVAARAIVWAADHHRRTLAVGAPTVVARWAQKLIPGLADRYLAATAYSGQQIADQPDTGSRPDNLFQPLPGDAGAHGDFGHRSISYCPQQWLDRHRTGLAFAAGLVSLALLLRSSSKR